MAMHLGPHSPPWSNGVKVGLRLGLEIRPHSVGMWLNVCIHFHMHVLNRKLCKDVKGHTHLEG